MVEIINALILGIIQGVTEWLPVSSSGHIVIAGKLIQYEKNLMFQVALHFGTLMSVFVYFGKDIMKIIEDILKKNWKTENAKLGFMIIIATIPAGIVGFLFKKTYEEIFLSLPIVAISSAITAVFLFIASLNYFKNKSLNFNYGSAFLVGLAQIFSILPGISRSGATLSASLILGLNEKQAIKFSFLMSIPIIFGANILLIGNNKLEPDLILASLFSFIVGLIALYFLDRKILTNRKNLIWFGLYALLISIIITFFLFFNI